MIDWANVDWHKLSQEGKEERLEHLAQAIYINDPDCSVAWAFERASDFFNNKDKFIEFARNK